MAGTNLRTIILVFLGCLCFSSAAEGGGQAVRYSTASEIMGDFEGLPCRNDERLDAVRAVFEAAGAPEESISVERFESADNLVLTRRSDPSRIIVIGAHYDVAGGGCGAIDNWSGVTILAHLYRTIRQFEVEKTILFVAFGEEERGLRGSRAMAEAIPAEERDSYCAMINVDSFGLGAPIVLRNISSPKLTRLVEDLAEEMSIPFGTVDLPVADSDSSSFISERIPAVTLGGLSNDWDEILHSRRDQVDQVNPDSVYLGYRLALALWSRVELAPCDDYR